MDFKTCLFSSWTVCLIICVLQLATIHGKTPKDQVNRFTRLPQKGQPGQGGSAATLPDYILVNISDSFNCEELSTIRQGLRYLSCITCLYFTTNSDRADIDSRIIDIERYQPDQQKSAPTGYPVYIDNITIHTVVREIVRKLNVMKNYRDSAVDENANSTDAESENTNVNDAESENANINNAESENANSTDTEFDNANINDAESENANVNDAESVNGNFTDAESENGNSSDAESEIGSPTDAESEIGNSTDTASETGNYPDAESMPPVPQQTYDNRLNLNAYASLAEQTFGNGNGLSTIDKLSSTEIETFNNGYCSLIENPIVQIEKSCTVVFAIAKESINAEITRTNEWYQRYKKDGEAQEDCKPCGSSESCDCNLPRFNSVEDCRNASGIQLDYRMPRYQCVKGECQPCDADEIAYPCEYGIQPYNEEDQCTENCKPLQLYHCSSIGNDNCVLYGSDNSTGSPPLLKPPFASLDDCKISDYYECGYPEIYQCIDGNCRACGASEGQENCDLGVTGYNGLDNCIAETECES